MSELPEPKDEIETENEEFEIELDEQASERTKVEAEPQNEEPVQTEAVEETNEQDVSENEEELTDYTAGVQKRIEKLTYRRREAERREQAALEYAEALKNQVSQLQQQQESNSSAVVDQFGTRVASELETAKIAYQKAHEEGDTEALFQAQQNISRLALDQAKYEEAKKKLEVQREAPQQAEAIPAPAPAAPQQQAPAAEPDPKAQAWAEKNSWFGEDQSMTYAAFGIHRQLVEEEGYDPSSDEYYAELDTRIQNDFPSKFQPKKKPQQRVAAASNSASRATTKGGKKVITLSDSQKAIARKLNVPYEDYAKEVAKLQKDT